MGTTEEKLQRLVETKASIRSAIEEKGVVIEDTDPFSIYPGKIGKIKGGSKINGPTIQGTAAAVIGAGDVVSAVEDANNIVSGIEDSANVSDVVFSPDGSLAVVSLTSGENYIYAIDGISWEKKSAITMEDGSVVIDTSRDGCMRFSPDGKQLLIAGEFDDVYICNVNGTDIVDSGVIVYQNDEKEAASDFIWDGAINTCNFSPDGKLAVFGGEFTEKAVLFAVSGTTFTRLGEIPADAAGTALNGTVFAAEFTPDGSYLILGGAFTGKAKLYQVNSAGLTYLNDIKDDANGATITNSVYDISFSPDGAICILNKGSRAGTKIALYAHQTGVLSFRKNILDGTGKNVSSMGFSKDGTLFVVAGTGIAYNRAAYFTVDGETFSNPKVIYATDKTIFDAEVVTVAFSDTLLTLGGKFTGKTRYYTASTSNVRPPISFASITENETQAQLGKDSVIAVAEDDIASGDFGSAVMVATVDMDGVTADYQAREKEIEDASTTLNTINGETIDTTLQDKADAALASKNSVKTGLSSIGMTPPQKFSEYGPLVAGIQRVQNITGMHRVTATAESAISRDGVCRVLEGNGEINVKQKTPSPTFSPDGKTLILAGISSEGENVLGVLNQTNRSLQLLPEVSGASAAVISPDGKTVLFTGGTIGYKMENGRLISLGSVLTFSCRQLKFISNASVIASTDELSRLDWDGSAFTKTVVYRSGAISGFQTSPDNQRMIYIVSSISEVQVNFAKILDTGLYNLAAVPFSTDVATWPTGLANIPNAIFFSPDGSYLYIFGGFEGLGKVYSVSGDTITYIKDLEGLQAGAVKAYDGERLVALKAESGRLHVMLYSLTGETLTLLEDHVQDAQYTQELGGAAISPDGSTVVAACGMNNSSSVFFYLLDNGTLTQWTVIASPVADNLFEVPEAYSSIGVAENDIASGSTGDIAIIAQIENGGGNYGTRICE